MRYRRLVPLVVILALALATTGATCRTHPRHTAQLSLNAFAQALAGVQDGEVTLYAAGKVSVDTHALIQAKILKVATIADEAQTTLDAWQPGQPVPRVLGPVMVAAKDLMREVTALLPLSDTLRVQIQTIYEAITDILVLVAG